MFKNNKKLHAFSSQCWPQGGGRRQIMNTAEDDLFISVCTLFNESQFHVSSHRKNIQSLRKIHAKSSGNSLYETQFLQAFCHCLHTILSMKKADDVNHLTKLAVIIIYFYRFLIN